MFDLLVIYSQTLIVNIIPDRKNPPSKRVMLMGTCLCDAFFDDVGRATVEVLEHVGCEVIFPEAQTCCGQPAFNAGDWNASRKVVRHVMETFAGDEPILVPSGSCAAMLLHGAPLEFENEPDLPEVQALAKRTWEFGDYLVNGLGIKKWEGKFPHKVAFHKSCHTRGTQSGEAAIQLMESIEGLEVLPFDEKEQCCGFGGTFSVSYPNVSRAMGQLKISHIVKQLPEYLIAVDMGCGLHLGGIIHRDGIKLSVKHLSQVLRDSLK